MLYELLTATSIQLADRAVDANTPHALMAPCGQRVSAALGGTLRKPQQGDHCLRAAGPIESAAQVGLVPKALGSFRAN